MNCAFLFPGQGSQAVGMGMDIADNFECAKRVFNKADEVLGFSITQMIKEGPEEELKQTANTQPSVVTVSIALMEVLKEKGITCNAAAGHSVGEYAALYCAGMLTLDECLDLTRSRGIYMGEAGDKYPGTLSAVMGLELEKVEQACEEASEKGVVVVANLNSPGQVVISGDIEAVSAAEKAAMKLGATKTVPLKVSAAFHSPLMDEAAAKLSEKIDTITFKDADIPVYSNVTAEPVKDGSQMKELMKKQIVSRVYWEKSIKKMQADGIDTFIEIGPGKVLSGMLKKIDRKINVHNFSDLKTLEKLLEKLNIQAVEA